MPRHGAPGPSFGALIIAILIAVVIAAFGIGLVVGRDTAPVPPAPPPVVVMVPAPTKLQTPARQFLNCIIDQECTT